MAEALSTLLTLVQIFIEMATIVIKLDPKANQSKLIETIQLLKGVKSITVASDEDISDQFMASQMSASRKSGKGNKDRVLEFLGN